MSKYPHSLRKILLTVLAGLALGLAVHVTSSQAFSSPYRPEASYSMEGSAIVCCVAGGTTTEVILWSPTMPDFARASDHPVVLCWAITVGDTSTACRADGSLPPMRRWSLAKWYLSTMLVSIGGLDDGRDSYSSYSGRQTNS